MLTNSVELSQAEVNSLKNAITFYCNGFILDCDIAGEALAKILGLEFYHKPNGIYVDDVEFREVASASSSVSGE